MMMNYDLRFYAKGSAFKDDIYDLRSMELLLSSYRSITDRLIAVQLGRRQLTPAIKNQIDYDVKINSGSIEFLVDFVFTHKELLGVLTIDGGYQLSSTITKLFKEAIDLRKKVASALENGHPINITINNNMNIGKGNIIANADNGNIVINDPKILWAAQVTKYPSDRLISKIDGESIEYVEFGTKNDELKLSSNEHNILGQNREELSATLVVIGRLDMIVFSSHKGTIISNNEKFPVTWDENIRTKVQTVADKKDVAFTVRPIIDQKKLHSDTIAYHVLDCKIPQQRLDV